MSEADEIIATIRRRLDEYLGPGANSSARLKEVFADIDRNGNNRIDRHELQKAMRVLDVALTMREINLIFDHFDSDGSNDFDYREFLDLLNAKVVNSEKREELIKETDEVISSIRRQTQENFGRGMRYKDRIRFEFDDMDRKGTNRVYRKELLEIFTNLNVKISPYDYDILFERFDRKDSTTMDYRELINTLCNPSSTANESKGPGSPSKSKDPLRASQGTLMDILLTQVNDIIENIKFQIIEQFGKSAVMKRRVYSAFDEVDPKTTYTIRPEDLATVFDQLRIQDIRARDIDLLYSRFDPDGSNLLDYRELRDMICDETDVLGSSNSTSSSVQDVIDAIRKALADYIGPTSNVTKRLKEVFASIDDNGNNRIERKELKIAMETLKVELSPRDLSLLLKRFDRDGSNNFDYNEFLEMVVGNK